MSDVEMLLRVRDGLQMAVDGLTEYLEKKAPVNKASWNPESIKWCQAEGSKGPYERYPAEGQKAESTADYHNLLQDLKDHQGKLSHKGFFYWVFVDQATIGRKGRNSRNLI